MKLMKYLFTSRTHRRPSRQKNGLVCVCLYFVTGEVAVNEWSILDRGWQRYLGWFLDGKSVPK